MKPHPSPPPCYGGLLITAWPLTIVISIMVQCFITAWRVDHRKRIYMRHHHPHQHAGHAGHNAGHMPHSGAQPQPGNPHVPMRRSQSRTRETREEARQRKFRYLYQVRTARGDIISQVSSKCAPTEQQTDLSLSLSRLQNFVSALQKRIQLSGTETPSERSIKTSSNERNTFRSDRTHFTTIHDPEMCDKIEIVRDIG